MSVDDTRRTLSVIAERADPSRSGDSFITRSCETSSRLLEAISSAQGVGFRTEGLPIRSSRIDWDHRTRGGDATRRWRSALAMPASEAIHSSELKQVFDMYFRDDFYGKYRLESTLMLCRGIRDPNIFAPPAAVSIALDTANREGWYGYSDSLGHENSRNAVAALERVRRCQAGIEIDNVGLVQGGAQGLHSVLCCLKDKGIEGRFLVPVPNYAPIVESVQRVVGAELYPLNSHYGWHRNQLLSRLADTSIAGMVVSLPHNPVCGDGSIYSDMCWLAETCDRMGKHLLVDEVCYSPVWGQALDPLSHPSTILIL